MAGLLALGLLWFSNGAVRAQTITNWDGGDGDWFTGSWSAGTPTSGSEAVILGDNSSDTVFGSGPNVTISSGSAAASDAFVGYGSSLTVSNGASLTAANAVEIYEGSVLTLKSGATLSAPILDVDDNAIAYLVGNTSAVQVLDLFGGATVYVGIDPVTGASGNAETLQAIQGTGNIILGTGTILTVNQSSADTNSVYYLASFAGVISGAGGLNVVTGGTIDAQLTLSGVNTYTGATTIGTNATLFLSGSGSIASSQSVSINTGGVLDISGLTSGTTIQNLSGDTTGTIALGVNTLTDQLSASNTFGGLIGGSGGFATEGTGTLTFDQTAANSYTGATAIGTGTTLVLGAASSIATSSAVTVNGALDISAGAQSINDLTGSGSVFLGAQTLTVTTATGASDVFSGSIADGGASNGTGGSLAVAGGGTEILSGTNTYTGATGISGTAILQLGDGGTTGSLGAGTISIGSGSGLAFDHSSGTSFTLGNTISSADDTGSILQEGGNTILNGNLSGFTGNISVTGGTLEVDSTGANALAAAAAVTVSDSILQGTGSIAGSVTVNNGGTLAAGTSLATGTLTIGTLVLTSGSTVVVREVSGTSHDSFSITNATLGGTGEITTLDFALTGATNFSTANALNAVSGTTTTGSFSNIALSGSGDLTVSAANDFGGVITVDSPATLTLAASGSISAASAVAVNGTLDISAGAQTLNNLSGSGSVLLGSQILTVENSGTNTFSGSISGNGGVGNLVIGGTGTFILSGTNTYSGGTTIGGTATLQVGDGTHTGSLGTGSVDIYPNATVAFDGNANTPLIVNNLLIGTGQLIQQSGITVIDGGSNLNYTGTTTVSGGILEIDSAIPVSEAFGSSTINVTGGTLQGTGSLAGNVNVSGGTLGAGTISTPGTLHIAGNLTMTSNSNAVFRVNSGSSDLVVVNGNATIAGNASFYVSGVTIRPGTSANVMEITGTETGTFNVSSVLGNALLYTSVWDAATHYLQMDASEGSFIGFASGGNQAAVATNLNSLVSNGGNTINPLGLSVINYLNTLTRTQLSAALSQMSPTSMASMPAVVLASSDNVDEALSARMGALRAGSTGLTVQNLNLGPNTDFDSSYLLADNSDTAPIGYNPIPFNFLASTPDNRWGTFISGLGTSGQVNDAAEPGYNYYSGGFQAGIDYRLFPSLTVGIAGGYQHGQTDFNQSDSTISTDTGNLQLYSTWHDQSGDWAAGNIGGAYDWFDSKRESLDGTADAKPEGTEINSMLQVGRDFTRNNWTMTPSLGLLYNRTMLDGYSENGSLTPLTVDSHDLDSLRTRLGFRLANQFTVGAGAIPIQPYVEAGWQHEYLNQDEAFDARFASGAGGLFSVTGRNVGSDSATFGFGVSALFSPSITAAISYFGQGNSDYLENDIEGTLRYMF